MRIKVEFDHLWSIEEVKAYLSDPDNPRYNDEMLGDDAFIELAACAYEYVRYEGKIDDLSLNAIAKEDIESGIRDNFFYNDLCKNYICWYLDNTLDAFALQLVLQSTAQPCDGNSEYAFQIANKYFLIHDHEEGWDYYLLDDHNEVLSEGIEGDACSPLGETVKRLFNQFQLSPYDVITKIDFSTLYKKVT